MALWDFATKKVPLGLETAFRLVRRLDWLVRARVACLGTLESPRVRRSGRGRSTMLRNHSARISYWVPRSLAVSFDSVERSNGPSEKSGFFLRNLLRRSPTWNLVSCVANSMTVHPASTLRLVHRVVCADVGSYTSAFFNRCDSA